MCVDLYRSIYSLKPMKSRKNLFFICEILIFFVRKNNPSKKLFRNGKLLTIIYLPSKNVKDSGENNRTKFSGYYIVIN